MAKVSFTKLDLKKNQNIKTINWNEQIIEIKQYLPINDKLALISQVINISHDENLNFSNPIKNDVFLKLYILYYYTNINFTEKQKKESTKLYDLVSSSGLIDEILKNIPQKELNYLQTGLNETIQAIYTYRNSLLGILENIKEEYSDMELDATEIQQQLANSENIEFLKEILNKLG